MLSRIDESTISQHVPLILQARVQSTRYPGKVLKPFAEGLNLLEFQLMRLRSAFPDAPIVVATSTETADDPIPELAKRMGVFSFRGDERDVLKRFIDCCHHFGFNGYIIRICGDNPFLQLGFLRTLMKEAAESAGQYDYIGFSIDHTPAIRTHFGFFAELVAVKGLLRIHETVEDAFFREHVTSYIYESTERFSLRWLELQPLIPFLGSLRLTIDSREDFDNAVYIYQRLHPASGRMGPTWEAIVSLVENEPETKRRMIEQIGSNQK